MVFPVVTYRCESLTIKKAEHQTTDAFELCLKKSLENPLDCKDIQPVNPKRNQSRTLTGSTDAEASILWPPDVKNWLTGKDPDAGKDWRPEEKGMTEDEMVGWHHQLNGHVSEQAPGWTRRPGVLQSMGSQRVRHDWAKQPWSVTYFVVLNVGTCPLLGRGSGHLQGHQKQLPRGSQVAAWTFCLTVCIPILWGLRTLIQESLPPPLWPLPLQKPPLWLSW